VYFVSSLLHLETSLSKILAGVDVVKDVLIDPEGLKEEL